ncbi:MAG: 3-hydroxybutyryl-CoA dehydrogenase [Bacteroidia bacterium]|nr:3-hydroxybutyryl-CoA dehydrogenase [Bacteroidia bacterium]
MKIEDIRKVLILGSGTLGLRVGLQAAVSGFETTIVDVSEASNEKAKVVHEKILRHLVKHGRVQAAELDEVRNRITWSTDLKTAARDADFVNESVTEELALKQKVWAQLGEFCPPRTVFTTNTSYLLPSQMAEATGRPARFCAFHFHDVFTARVVDIMPHPGTADWMIPLLVDMGKRLNQIPVVMKRESPGYIFNSILMAVLGAAGALVTYDIASVQEVDRSWMGNFNTPSGPFGIIDEIGLDTAWHVLKNRKDEKSVRFAALLRSMLDQGKLGLKSGEGFYKYPQAEFKQEGFLG